MLFTRAFSPKPLPHSRRPLLSRTALALVLGGVSPLPAFADCTVTGNAATCSGDVTGGASGFFTTTQSLTIENTTTVLGGRAIVVSNNSSDVTVNADFAPFGLVNEPGLFPINAPAGVRILATAGSADITLIGDMTIQAGTDRSGTTTVASTLIAGVETQTRGDLTISQTGDITVTHGNLTASSGFVAAVDTERFSGISALSTGTAPANVTLTREGDLTVFGPNMTATATDAIGSNRAIVANTASSGGNALYGILATAAGEVEITNTGDITLLVGDITATTNSTGGRAETNTRGAFVSGIGVPRAADTQYLLGAVEFPRNNGVTIRQTGDILVGGGETTATAIGYTESGGPLSSAVVDTGTNFLSNDRLFGVRVDNTRSLDAEFIGDIMAIGGDTNAVANALAGPDNANGLVAARVFATAATGLELRGRSIFTENDTDNDGRGTVTIDGALTVTGGSVTAALSGSGLALAPVSGFPPPDSGTQGTIELGGGDAWGISFSSFSDETTISANPATQSRSIEQLYQMDLTLTGPVTATGGNVTATLNGSNLPGRYTGGYAISLGTSFGGITLTTDPAASFTSTGGAVDVTLNGAHGQQRLQGGRALGPFLDLQSNGDQSFTADSTAYGGAARLTGMAGSASGTTYANGSSIVEGGNATGLSIGVRSNYTFGQEQTLTDAQRAELDARRLFVTGTITAIGGDASATDPHALTIGGDATGIEVKDGTRMVLQGDVLAIAGTGVSYGGAVAGVQLSDNSFFYPDVVPLDRVATSLRVEGSVSATGQGLAISDLSNVPNGDANTLDSGILLSMSGAVRSSAYGLSEIEVADGGRVTSTGDYVHGILAAGEKVNIRVENGGSVMAQGLGAAGIELRPYQAPAFGSPGEALAADTTITIAQGGTVSSQLGTAIQDESRRQANDFNDLSGPHLLESYDNRTTVDLAGTVTGGNGTAISLGSGSDRVVMRATAIANGDVDLGAGDDELEVFDGATVNGVMDLGAGSDTLAFNAAAGTTASVALFSGGIAFADGFERIEKRGIGTWVFTGDAAPVATPSATAFIRAGTAVINGGFAHVNVTNEAAGRLEGSGQVQSLTNAGTLSPGGQNTIAEFQVENDLTLSAGGTLEMDIRAPGQSDRINVGGNTTLGGTLAVNAMGLASDYSTANRFTLIHSSGAVAGAFADLADNLPDLDLTIGVEPAAGGSALVLGLSEMAVPDTLSDKSIHPNSLQAAALADQGLLTLLHARSNGAPAPASPGPARLSFVAQAPGAAKHFAWGSVFGASRKVKGGAAYDASSGGFAIGYEQAAPRAGGGYRLGFAVSGASTKVSSGLSSAKTKATSFGLYGSIDRDRLRLSGAITFGHLSSDFDRVIPVGAGFVTAKGHAKGSSFSASAKLAYDIAPALPHKARRLTRLAPYLRLDYLSVKRDGFTETGAGVLNLAVAADSFSQSSVRLGLEGAAELRARNGLIARPYFDIHWEHLLHGRFATSHSVIAGTPAAAFASIGATEARNRIGIGAGLRIDLSKRSTLDLHYTGSFRRGHATHAASATFRMAF